MRQIFLVLQPLLWLLAGPVPPEERDKTAFVTHNGLFRCTAMPFGLVNAPAVFQRMMNTALADCIASGFCRVYIDDIVVYSKTYEEHVAHLDAVLSAIEASRLVCKPPKCYVGYRQIVHLGHLVGSGGIRVDPSTTRAIDEYPEPRNASEVRSFLGLAGYCRGFIEHFSELAAPLYDLTHADSPSSWKCLPTAARCAFDDMRAALVSAPCLALQRFDREFVLRIDAPARGLGAMRLQHDDAGEVNIARFLSRTATPAEQRYDHPSKLESRAVVWTTERLRQYLLGRHFTLQTDARNLVWLSQRQLDRGQYARWIVQLSEYDFTVEHAAVPAEDALSRHPVGELAAISVVSSAPSFAPSSAHTHTCL